MRVLQFGPRSAAPTGGVSPRTVLCSKRATRAAFRPPAPAAYRRRCYIGCYMTRLARPLERLSDRRRAQDGT